MKRFMQILCAAALALGLPVTALADQSGGCLPTTGTYSGLTAAGYINSGFTSLFSSSSGASAPANPCGGNPLRGQFWLDTSSGTLQSLNFYDGSQWLQIGTVDVTGHRWQPAGLAQGQVRLSLSGSNLVLLPFNGNQLTIGSINRTVPLAGASLAPTGLTANTTYYIYAAMSGSNIALEASTTTHILDTSGLRLKSGDPSRTLVGMVRVVAGPAFADTATQRLVASWFNRRQRSATVNAGGSQVVSQLTMAAFPPNFTIAFVNWANEAVASTISSNWDVPDNPFSMFLSPWVDGSQGTATYGYHTIFAGGLSGNFYASDTLTFSVEMAEGYHTIGLGINVNGGNATFILNGVNSATIVQ